MTSASACINCNNHNFSSQPQFNNCFHLDSPKIAVEVKSFLSPSTFSEFHTAIGQCLNYRYALEDCEPDRQLYLAIPLEIYDRFFTVPFIQSVIQRSQTHLLIYEPSTEEIVQWKS